MAVLERVSDEVGRQLLAALDKQPGLTVFHGREVGGGHMVVVSQQFNGYEIRRDGDCFGDVAVEAVREAQRLGWTGDLQPALW